MNTISGKIEVAIVQQRNMHGSADGKIKLSKKAKDEREREQPHFDDDGEDDGSFCEWPGGGRMAGALPQSPDVQPSHRTYMHVQHLQEIHACGTGTTERMDLKTYNRLVERTHCSCICERHFHHTLSQTCLSRGTGV